MRALYPVVIDPIDPYDAARPDGGGQVRLNFVTSLDGSATDESGRSSGLGGAGDKAMFRALRAWADAILVGAGTVRTERYGPHRLTRALADRRAADGRPDPAAIVVVSRSLDLDLTAPLFTAARTPTVVLTCAAAPLPRRRAVAAAARLLVAGEERVDLADGLGQLAAAGLCSVLCEGGPTLSEALLADGLVGELCLTLAPALLGTGGPALAGRLPHRVDLALTQVLTDGAELFLRYAVQNRRRSPDSSPRRAS